MRGHRIVLTVVSCVVLGTTACTSPAPSASPPATGDVPSSVPATDGAAPEPSDDADMPVPVLTQATWNEPSSEVIASGLVGATLDAGAPCVFSFTQGAVELTRETTPEPGPSSLDCGSVYVPSDELGPGEWTIVLAYGAQRSAEAKVEVP